MGRSADSVTPNTSPLSWKDTSRSLWSGLAYDLQWWPPPIIVIVEPHEWLRFKQKFVQDCIARRWTHERAKQQLEAGYSIRGRAAKATRHINRYPQDPEVTLIDLLAELEFCFVGPLLSTPAPTVDFPSLPIKDSPVEDLDGLQVTSAPLLTYRDALVTTAAERPPPSNPWWYRRYRRFTPQDHVAYLMDGRVRV